MSESAFGVNHGDIAKSFSESKDRQKVTYKDKKGGKTEYKVRRQDHGFMDQLAHNFERAQHGQDFEKLPERAFTLERSKGRPRPGTGAKARPRGYSNRYTAPKKVNAYRQSKQQRKDERIENAQVGGVVGGASGVVGGVHARSLKGAAIAGTAGAALGAGVGGAWRPNTHRLSEPKKKVKKNYYDPYVGVTEEFEKAFGGNFKMPKIGGKKKNAGAPQPPNPAANNGYKAGQKARAGADKVQSGVKRIGTGTGKLTQKAGAQGMGQKMINNPGKTGAGVLGGAGLTGGVYANRKDK